jgi:hydrogenase nickel incorporation protein HypA/HybF
LHEVGVMIEVVKTVEKFTKQNSITKIETLVLQIGEISSMLPRYIKACYPMASEGTILENAKLEIEVLPCNAICKECNKVFNLLENIKEIVAC